MNYVFGTGGFAREVDWLTFELFHHGACNLQTDFFVAENGNELVGSALNAKPVICESEFFEQSTTVGVNGIVAVGRPALRREIVSRIKLLAPRTTFPSIVHPGVPFDSRAGKVRLGEGCVICAGAVLTSDIVIGDFAHVNNLATVSHDVIVGDFATVSPGAHVCGNVTLGRSVFLGAGSTVIERLTVCDEAFVGAGATVVRNIDEPGIYVGTPARRIR